MRIVAVGAWLAAVSIAASAQAALPDYVLERDYRTCLGNGAVDPQRAAYCACVRDGMRGWDDATYVKAATEAAAASKGGDISGPLADLAKQCMARVMR